MEKKLFLTRGDLQIPCLVTVPDYGEIRRVVLGVYGLGGSMMDDIQVSIAEEMDLFYSATIRFELPGHGGSPVEKPICLQDCMDSLMAAVEYAREAFPQVEDLCIFASGLGAYMTLLRLDDMLALPGKIKLVLQTPAFRAHEMVLAMCNINRETLWAMDQFTLPWRRPIVITYQFYEELTQHNALAEYPIPMMILHGEKDAFVWEEDIRQFHKMNEQSKMVLTPGVGHRFLEKSTWDMVLDLTRDWFEFEQVLLSDWD